MRVVPAVPFGVGGCSILPQRKADPNGFIHVTVPPPVGNQQFISAEAVKIMGHEFGMCSKEERDRLRFENHNLKKELDEAQAHIAENARLEDELLEAKQTISESREVIALFTKLMDDGYDPQKIKGLRKRVTSFKQSLDEVDETIAELDDALARAKTLVRAREKVPA